MNRITSKDNALIKKISLLNTNSKKRRESKQFVAEGLRICNEALNSHYEVSNVVVSDSFVEKNSGFLESIKNKKLILTCIPDTLFEKIADTRTPQGILCICNETNTSSLSLDTAKKYIALENISDPSNMGTIIRSADALGIDTVILSKDCCDPFSSKSVRGSMGAIFRLNFVVADANFPSYVTMLNNRGFKTYSAVVDSNATPVTDVSFKKGSIVIIGNEGNGLTEETVLSTTKRITIPMKGNAESLNASAAASILMWELMK